MLKMTHLGPKKVHGSPVKRQFATLCLIHASAPCHTPREQGSEVNSGPLLESGSAMCGCFGARGPLTGATECTNCVGVLADVVTLVALYYVLMLDL